MICSSSFNRVTCVSGEYIFAFRDTIGAADRRETRRRAFGIREFLRSAVRGCRVARNGGMSFESRLNFASLFGTQGRELKSVFGSEHTNDFRGDYLFVAVRQRNFEDHCLVGHKGFSDECPQATFAKISPPAL